jgi:SRSO17 transposase
MISALVEQANLRGQIERDFQPLKQELGFDRYEFGAAYTAL